MRSMNGDDAERYLLDLAKLFSGILSPSIDARLYADLGISGGDAVEFYKLVEDHFGIDISPVTETVVEVRKSWIRKSYQKIVACDPSLSEILAYIDGKTGPDRRSS